QILSVTCDNALNNNVMVRELSYKVPAFGGVTSHTQCFLHTVNLVAKSLISFAALTNIGDTYAHW
ncbi:hypothetical protein M405DRAFT_726459, partial [Rhizopogon salebrosus TDB-379]